MEEEDALDSTGISLSPEEDTDAAALEKVEKLAPVPAPAADNDKDNADAPWEEDAGGGSLFLMGEEENKAGSKCGDRRPDASSLDAFGPE